MYPGVVVINRLKFFTLRLAALIFEKIRIAAKSGGVFGTFGNEEFPIYAILFSDKKKPLSVIDVGANYGNWSRDFLELFQDRDVKINAIEPIPHFFQSILEINDVRLSAHNTAIGKNGDSIRVARVGGGGTAFPENSKLYPQRIKPVEWHELIAESGDSFIKKNGLLPDLIKIDTDGLDFQILHTFEEALRETRPVIQFEFTFRFARKANYTLLEIIDYLEEFNYTTYVISGDSRLKSVKFPRLEVLNHQTKNFIALPS